jgi:hypothetical protein
MRGQALCGCRHSSGRAVHVNSTVAGYSDPIYAVPHCVAGARRCGGFPGDPEVLDSLATGEVKVSLSGFQGWTLSQ